LTKTKSFIYFLGFYELPNLVDPSVTILDTDIYSIPFSYFAILKQIAITFAPASLTENNQFFRPLTFGQMKFSAELLSISIRPSFKNTFNPFVRFSVYSFPLASAFFLKNGEFSTQVKNSSTNAVWSALRGFFFVYLETNA